MGFLPAEIPGWGRGESGAAGEGGCLCVKYQQGQPGPLGFGGEIRQGLDGGWTEKAGVAGMKAPLALFPRGAFMLPAFLEPSCQRSWNREKGWVCYS